MSVKTIPAMEMQVVLIFREATTVCVILDTLTMEIPSALVLFYYFYLLFSGDLGRIQDLED